MNFQSFIVLLVIFVLLALAILYIGQNGGWNGGCTGNCASCQQHCSNDQKKARACLKIKYCTKHIF